MKIEEIQINGYGKIKNKIIKLKNGINIIYGKNEDGKSTLLNYISSSFYGISKKKAGKEISDYDKYIPWVGDEFSGRLKYKLDNGQSFEIFRDFKKTAPKIYNEQMEDVAKEFKSDKTRGNQFFTEQTGIDEELFKSTFLVNQNEVKLNNANQTMLIQKISNLVGTGEDKVSHKLAKDRLDRLKLEEIGTERSREKPINILTRKIEELENEKNELKQYETKKYELEEKINQVLDEIKVLENKNTIAEEIQLMDNKQRIENEKIKIQKDIESENNIKIQKLLEEKEKINEIEKDVNNQIQEFNEKEKKQNIITIIITILIIAANAFQFFYLKDIYLNIGIAAISIIFFFIYLFAQNKGKKEKKKKFNENKEKTNQEKINIESNLKILEDNNIKIQNEIQDITQRKNLEINLEKTRITTRYLDIISGKKLDEIVNNKDIQRFIVSLQKEINEKNMKLHTLEIDKNSIEEGLEKLANIEEEFAISKDRFKKLKMKEMSYELAKEVLELAYNEMKDEVTPKFTKQLSKNIAKITNKKYTKAIYSEEKGLIVETESGDYVPASRLSIGTVDQLYLSLRLSMIDDLSNEKLPIILDEAFAYFDEDRLKNILTYLSKDFKKRQVILFTCTNRETDILEKELIDFNYVNLNN